MGIKNWKKSVLDRDCWKAIESSQRAVASIKKKKCMEIQTIKSQTTYVKN
jgi:hypothetical protein